MLIRAYPQALIDTGDYDKTSGHLPIHALLSNPNVSQMTDIVHLLFSVYPGHIIKQDAGHGTYPLHIACENSNIDTRIIQIILDLSVSAQVDYNAGYPPPYLPIHSLCANRELDDEAALDILRLF